MAGTEVSKIAAEAHEKFGLTIPVILDASTDGGVAVVLRRARRDLIDSAYERADNGAFKLTDSERQELLAIVDTAEKFVKDRHLQHAYDAPC